MTEPSDFSELANAKEATAPSESQRKAWSAPKVIASEVFKNTSGPTFGAPETTPSIHTS